MAGRPRPSKPGQRSSRPKVNHEADRTREARVAFDAFRDVGAAEAKAVPRTPRSTQRFGIWPGQPSPIAGRVFRAIVGATGVVT